MTLVARLECQFSEETLTQCNELIEAAERRLADLGHDSVNLCPPIVDLGNGDFQFGVELGDIHYFAVVPGFDITADRQVVVVSADGLKGHRFGEVLLIGFAVEHLHDLLYVSWVSLILAIGEANEVIWIIDRPAAIF